AAVDHALVGDIDATQLDRIGERSTDQAPGRERRYRIGRGKRELRACCHSLLLQHHESPLSTLLMSYWQDSQSGLSIEQNFASVAGADRGPLGPPAVSWVLVPV